MKKAIIILLALVMMAGLVFAGCGQSEPAESAPAPAPAAPADNAAPATQAVKEEGSEYKETVYTAFNPLDTTDPYGSTITAPQMLTNMTFDTLTYLDADSGELLPELAKSWEDVSEEGNGGAWKVYLEEGVKFHNGNDFTAEDVKFTWEYTAQGAGNVVKPNAASAYVESYEIVDDYTIIFHLVNPMPDFATYLETKIYSKTAFDELAPEEAWAIGTGPYYYDTELSKTGVQYAVTRNEDYWRGLDAYPTKHIVIKEIADVNTRVAALIAGEVDFLFDVAPSSYNTVSNSSGIEVATRSGANSYYLGFNYANPLFSDVDVRRAIGMAINKEDIVNVVFEGGIGGTANNNFCVPTGLGYSEVDYIQYDLEKAKAEFERLGLTGKHLVLVGTTDQIKFAEVYQMCLNAAGLDVELKQADPGNWSAFKAGQEGYDMFVDYCAYQGALLYNFNRFYYSGGSSNVYGFQSDEYEALQDAVSAETTWDAMLDKFADLQDWVAYNVPVFPCARNNMIWAYKDTVGGIQMTPSNNYIDLSTIYCVE
ncbi:MAG: ABC transporter substrate-binding protein [Ruminococcaceae bacterium]|nr:ABC transporter substrate-binding protein [Oscillospiraceae bacterium]